MFRGSKCHFGAIYLFGFHRSGADSYFSCLARPSGKAAPALPLDLASQIVTVLDCGKDLLEVVVVA